MLRHEHDTIRALEPQLPGARDPEVVHRYRVAVRRSRSVLKLARDVMDDGVCEYWRSQLGDLQQRTNRLRDLDVFLLELETYRSALPPGRRDDLGPLRDHIAGQRAKARAAVRRRLRTASHRQLVDSYAQMLAAGPPDPPPRDRPEATRRIAAVARRRVRRAHRRLVRRAGRVSRTSPPGHLHRVRIAAKELRYCLELHVPVLPGDDVKEVVKRLRKLQDALGAFQDAEAHAAAMAAFAAELASVPGIERRHVEATEMLAASFLDRQSRLRVLFRQRLEVFDGPKNRRRIARLTGA